MERRKKIEEVMRKVMTLCSECRPHKEEVAGVVGVEGANKI